MCELLTGVGRAKQTFLAPGPVEGSKGQISFDFNYKVNFKDFAGGAQGVKKIFFKHAHVAYEIDRMTSRTECK